MSDVASCEIGGAGDGGCLGHCSSVSNTDCNAGEIGWERKISNTLKPNPFSKKVLIFFRAKRSNSNFSC